MIHCGFVGILGLPNVGKSSFLNSILEEKISIVSSKPQTTRQSFTGVLSNQAYQLILIDAPGYVEKKAGLFEFLNAEFTRVVEKSEHLLFLISHEQKDSDIFNLMREKIENSGKPVTYLFTKVDLEPTGFVLKLKKDLEEKEFRVGTFSIQKSQEDSHKDMLDALAHSLPQEHHPLYDPDMISLDRTRDIVAEFIREECFLQLEKEIPYSLGVIIKSFKKEKGLQRIEANILIEKENHKAIVIGKNGERLKEIGSRSRVKIQKLLGEKIFLGLHIAVKKNWQKNKAIMKELGYHNEPR